MAGVGGALSALIIFFAGWLFVKFFIVGVIAGFIAEKISGSDHTIWQNLGLGVLGALTGGFLAGLFNVNLGGVFGQLIIATFGALLLLYGYRYFKQSQREHEG